MKLLKDVILVIVTIGWIIIEFLQVRKTLPIIGTFIIAIGIIKNIKKIPQISKWIIDKFSG